MKNTINNIFMFIMKLFISAFMLFGILAAYGAAVLRESINLHPLTAAELAEIASGSEAELLTAEKDLNK